MDGLRATDDVAVLLAAAARKVGVPHDSAWLCHRGKRLEGPLGGLAGDTVHVALRGRGGTNGDEKSSPEDARAYLQRHGAAMEAAITKAVNTVMDARKDDPVAAIGRLLAGGEARPTFFSAGPESS